MATNKNIVAAARHYYVEQLKDAEEIAVLLNTPQRTIRSWIDKKNWKQERDARLNSQKERIENIKKVISNLTEQALRVQDMRNDAVLEQDKEQIASLDLQAVGIADQISKWNKALETLDKKGRIDLGVYLQVMDEVFGAMQSYDNKLFLNTLDFQQHHIEHVSLKYG